MAQAMRVTMARPADAGGLLRALAACGLSAELVSIEGRSEIEISDPRDATDEVAGEVSHALDAWFVERGLPFIPVRIGERAFTVRPPGD